MLSLKNLTASVDNKEILKNLSFDFEQWKNYCILGKNGSGKSSLAMSIIWNPKYQIQWDILLDWVSLKELSIEEKSKKWIFLSFQNIPEIPGVKVFEFLKTIYDTRQPSPSSFMSFKKIIEPLLIDLDIDKEFLRRDLNVGFSGGEKRKMEVLQIRLLKPSIIILDEIDSWLDVNAVKQVSQLLKKNNSEENSFIIITHLFEMLEGLPIHQVLVLEEWKIKEIGDSSLLKKIKKEGF